LVLLGVAIVGSFTGCQDKKSTESSSHVSSSGGIHGGGGRSRGDISTAKSETSSQVTTAPETTTQAPVTTTTPAKVPIIEEFKYNWTGEHVTDDFKKKVIDISDQLQIDQDDLMAVMAFESRFDPAIQNYNTNATGLIQFMPSTAESLGTTIDQLASMSAVDQLDYVYEYFKPRTGTMNNLGDIYMAVLWPRAIGEDDSYVLWSQGTNTYNWNAGLDVNSDGSVTRGEAVQIVIDRRNEYGLR